MFAVDVNFCTLLKSQGSQSILNRILLYFVGGGGWCGGILNDTISLRFRLYSSDQWGPPSITRSLLVVLRDL